MAQRGAQLDSEKFSCSICLDLLKYPVTVPCGHSYCSNCIKSHWDGEDNTGIYSCPQCRKNFLQRPELEKNIIIAELVEDLKKAGLQAAAVDLCYAGPEDVACDVCTGRKLKTVKSCLVCLASYCEEHLRPHYDSPAFKKHKLVEPFEKLQENICSRHNEVMKIFCRTDQQCICYLCMMDEHRGHETISSAAERIKKQKEVEVIRLDIQQRIQEREQAWNLFEQLLEAINVSADEAVGHSKMTCFIQKQSCEMKHQLRSQQQTTVRGVKELQEKLENELAELKRNDVQLEQLAHTEDHNQFLHSYPSESALCEPTRSSSIQTAPLRYFEDVAAAVSESREKLQDILRGTNISLKSTKEELLLPQPKIRDHFLQYSQQITLDPNTAHRDLVLSDWKRKVTLTWENQPYCDHPDRFTGCFQVLNGTSLTGRHYWEVEWRGVEVYVGVTYKNISRSGRYTECVFGLNDKSWALYCDACSFLFRHDNTDTPISGPWSSRVGVYLDHTAGILSFYSICETMTLLHRVQTTFTQPLYAGVWIYGYAGDYAKFLKP